MKAHKPNTDQFCTFTVHVNGFACQEHMLPPHPTSDTNVLECFIPVSSGDRLTIHGHFIGTVVHGAFDVLADGSFLADKRIEGGNAGVPKFYKQRKLDWDKVFDTPKPEGYGSIYPPLKVVEGDLNVQQIEEEQLIMMSFGGDKYGVGSLVVIVSLTQKPEDNYIEKYESMVCGASLICGAWKDFTDSVRMSSGGVVPTHSLDVKVTDEEVHKNRQSKHRRHCTQTRFGKRPWAKFVFYYRSQMAIQQAGCVTRPDRIVELDAEDGDDFVRAGPETPKRKKKENVEETNGDDDVDEGNEQLTRAESLAEDTPSPFQQKKKKKLLGQSLFKAKSPETLFVSEASPEANASTSEALSASSSSLVRPQDTSIVNEKGEGDELSAFMARKWTGARRPIVPVANMGFSGEVGGSDAISNAWNSKASALLASGVHDTDNAEVDAVDEDAGQFLDGTEIDNAASRFVEASKSALAMGNVSQPTPAVQQAEVHIKKEPQGQVNTLSTSTAMEHTQQHTDRQAPAQPKDQRRNFILEDICHLASDQGVISFRDLHKYFDDHDMDERVGVALVRKVAVADGSSWLLKGSEAASDVAEQPKADAANALPTEQAGTPEEDTVTTKVKTEPGHQQPASSPNTAAMLATSTPSPLTDPTTPTPSSTKRAASTSRESTPSKKAKLSDLQKRVAELKALAEEKHKRKLAFKKQVEREQKQKAEEAREREEAVMKQIEELEKLNAEEDEEMAELEKLRAMQDEEVEDE